jgi:hypothetical protein
MRGAKRRGSVLAGERPHRLASSKERGKRDSDRPSGRQLAQQMSVEVSARRLSIRQLLSDAAIPSKEPLVASHSVTKTEDELSPALRETVGMSSDRHESGQ